MIADQHFSTGNYHGSRLEKDSKRGEVWAALWRFFFSSRIKPDYSVLDLGAGHGDFINNVQARRRIAIDQWADMPGHVDSGVEAIMGSITDLTFLDDHSIDYAFASNIFEHIHKSELVTVLDQLANKLSDRGTLTILQPNFRYCFRN